MNRDRQKKIALSKVFNNEKLKKGDFVEFIHGNTLWEVTYASDQRYSIRAIVSGRYLYCWKKDWRRLFKISNEEALRKICLHRPLYFMNNRHRFKEWELIEFFKKHLKR